jgi:carboxymethylenebutenolidase
MKRIMTLILTVVSLGAVAQEKKSLPACCQLPESSTAQFAMLSTASDFKAAHLNPTPFQYHSPNGEMISFKTPDGKEGKAFKIAAKKPTKNVVFVIQEWWGLNDYIKKEAEQIQTELGDADVYALDMYDGKIAGNREDAAKYMQEAKEERLRAIVAGAIAHVGAEAKIATVGWCFGGGWSLQTSLAAGKQGVACVMYYGMPEKDIAKLKMLNAPVLGIFAKQDAWITPAVAETFEKQMKEAGKSLTVKMYDADHAFANPSNPKYKKDDADDAHKATIAFFKSNLGLK